MKLIVRAPLMDGIKWWVISSFRNCMLRLVSIVWTVGIDWCTFMSRVLAVPLPSFKSFSVLKVMAFLIIFSCIFDTRRWTLWRCHSERIDPIKKTLDKSEQNALKSVVRIKNMWKIISLGSSLINQRKKFISGSKSSVFRRKSSEGKHYAGVRKSVCYNLKRNRSSERPEYCVVAIYFFSVCFWSVYCGKNMGKFRERYSDHNIITILWKLSRCYWAILFSLKNPLEGEKNYGEK